MLSLRVGSAERDKAESRLPTLPCRRRRSFTNHRRHPHQAEAWQRPRPFPFGIARGVSRQPGQSGGREQGQRRIPGWVSRP